MKWTKKLHQKSFTRKLYDDNYEKQIPKSFFPISLTQKINGSRINLKNML